MSWQESRWVPACAGTTKPSDGETLRSQVAAGCRGAHGSDRGAKGGSRTIATRPQRRAGPIARTPAGRWQARRRRHRPRARICGCAEAAACESGQARSHPARSRLRANTLADERDVLAAAKYGEQPAPQSWDAGQEFEHEQTFVRNGIGPDVVGKLRRGHWSVQAELDLHGLTTDEAHDVLADFVVGARDARAALRARDSRQGPDVARTRNPCSRARCGVGSRTGMTCSPTRRRRSTPAAVAPCSCCSKEASRAATCRTKTPCG